MLISSCVCSGWVPASSSPLENKKTCFASGGVERGGLSGFQPAPQQGCQRAAACCYWRDTWLSGCLFPPAVQAWLAGEEAPGLRGPSRTPCHNKGTMAWMGWWVAGRAASSVPCSHQRKGQFVGRSAPCSPPPPCLVFHLVGHTVSHRGAKENSGLRKCLWAVAGVQQPWEAAELGKGTREGEVLHRLHSAWDCS